MILEKNDFPCWKWLTHVEHSEQYMYNVWLKHILHIIIYTMIIHIVCWHLLVFRWQKYPNIMNWPASSTRSSKNREFASSSIGPFWALTGPLAMSLSVSESWYCWIYTLHCTVLSVSRLAPRGPYYFKFIFWIKYWNIKWVFKFYITCWTVGSSKCLVTWRNKY